MQESGEKSICCSCIFILSPKTRTCCAFLDGIPDAIWNGETAHDKHVPGDHGLKYRRLVE